MTARELITRLLECDLDKEVFIEYPNTKNVEEGNYCSYEHVNEYSLQETISYIIIGIEDYDY